MCRAVFDERTEGLAAAVTTDDRREFDLGEIAPGRYVPVGFFEGSDRVDVDIESRIAAAAARSAARIREIVAQYGWPSSDLVGVDGTRAAFLIVQHANPALQKEMLPRVRDALRTGDLRGESYALLLDRVLVRREKADLRDASQAVRSVEGPRTRVRADRRRSSSRRAPG